MFKVMQISTIKQWNRAKDMVMILGVIDLSLLMMLLLGSGLILGLLSPRIDL